jgi:hypothetical protein
MTIDEIIECRVMHGETRYISVRGEAQSTHLSLSENIVDLGTVYVDCPVTHSFTAKNHSYLTTSYYWYIEEPDETVERGYVLDIDKSSGTLSSSAAETFIITFLPKIVGEYEALLPCFIQEDRDNVIGVIVKARVQGLDVSVKIKDAEGQIMEENVLDFGEIRLFERNELTVSMINKSQCETQYMLAFERFGAPIQHSRRPKVKELASPNKTTKRSESKQSTVSRTGHYESLSYQSHQSRSAWDDKVDRENEREFNRELLVEGNGIAFDADQLNGKIVQYATVDISVMVYSNACGVYEDRLQLDIVGLPTVLIPIRVTVVGTPIMFLPKTLGLKFDRTCVTAQDDIAQLSWLTVPVNANAPTKTVHVKNFSLTDLKVSWSVSKEFPIWLQLTDTSGGIVMSYGERDDYEQPFTIEPTTQIIPPNESKPFSLGFKSDRQQIYNELMEANCQIVQGNNPQQVQNHFSITGDVTSLMRPLRLALTASTTATRLHMNHKKIKFICSIGDRPESSPSFKKSIILTNNMPATVSFTVTTDPREIFIVSAPAEKKKKLDNTMRKPFTLSPQQEVSLDVFFALPQIIEQESGVRVFSGNLIVMFSNDEKQTFDIVAELHFSQLKVSPLVIDFGTIKKHQYNPLQFSTLPLYIQNMSRVARGKWKIVSVEGGTEQEPVFVLSTTEGTTPYSSSLIEGKSVVYIDFKPKTNDKFEYRFDVVAMSDDDRPLNVIGTVTCSGSSHFDEFVEVIRTIKKK